MLHLKISRIVFGSISICIMIFSCNKKNFRVGKYITNDCAFKLQKDASFQYGYDSIFRYRCRNHGNGFWKIKNNKILILYCSPSSNPYEVLTSGYLHDDSLKFKILKNNKLKYISRNKYKFKKRIIYRLYKSKK